jgi:hypothetical protein
MMFRGKVTNVDTKGVYVQTAEFGTLGPCQAVVANYAVGDMVLCDNVGDEASPELVVVGRLTGTGSTTSGSSVDNTVARFDGTGGKLQGSSVTIDDSGNVGGVAGLNVSKAAYAGVQVSSNAGTGPYIQLATAGVGRWDFFRNDETESGSGAGSNLQINRLSDAGGLAGTPIKINRATGRVTFGDVGSTAGLELGSSGPTITVGTGAPSHSAPNGSVYLRTDGTSTTTLYIRAAGAWVAK